MTRKVFVSYCKEDSGWLEKIKKFIVPRGLAESEGLDLWDDTRIPPGSEWNEEIANAITGSQCSLLLVSQDFLNSEFIWKHEVPKLIELKAAGHLILWIPLRPATISRYRLSELQALCPPDVPLSKMPEADQEEALVRIADAFEKFAGQSLADPPGGQIAPAAAPVPASTVPELRRHAKETLHTLIDRQPQETQLIATASSRSRDAGANILLLPYSIQDCPDLLMQRIEDYTFPERIKQPAQLRSIDWPRDAASSAEGLRSYVFDVLASESIAITTDDIGSGTPAETAALGRFRAKIEKRALVFWSELRSEAPDAEQKKLLLDCIAWWRNFTLSETVFPFALFCFRHRLPAAAKVEDLKGQCGWYDGCLDQVPARTLRPLQPITFDDIENWLSIDPIRRAYGMAKVRSAAEALFEGKESLPMKKIRQEFEDNWLGRIDIRSG